MISHVNVSLHPSAEKLKIKKKKYTLTGANSQPERQLTIVDNIEHIYSEQQSSLKDL